jgi:hypothetical protein
MKEDLGLSFGIDVIAVEFEPARFDADNLASPLIDVAVDSVVQLHALVARDLEKPPDSRLRCYRPTMHLAEGFI